MVRQRDRYRFVLKCGDDEHVATPIYKGLKKVWEQESGEIFFREKLDGELRFVCSDYDFLRSCDFSKEVELYVYKATDSGEELYFAGYFRRTDCETDINHKIIMVKPKTNDKYRLIMNKLNEEYNLVKHNPKMSDVSMVVRPMLQVYELGADYVCNFMGNNLFKQDVSPIYDLTNYTYMKFGIYPMCVARPIQIYNEDLKDNLFFNIGTWEAQNDSVNTELLYVDCDDGEHRLIIKSTQSALENSGNKAYRILFDKRQSDGTWKMFGAYKNPTTGLEWLTRTELESLTTANLYIYGTNTGLTNDLLAVLSIDFTTICSRLVWFDGGDSNISEEDAYINSDIYNKVVAYPLEGRVYASVYTSNEITQYGRVEGSEDMYYVPSYDAEEVYKYEPLLQKTWNRYWSFWLQIYDITTAMDSAYSKTKTLKDWYSMYEVIRVLLQAIDPNVKITHGSGSSMFLWNNTNPITGMQNQGEMFLLQKSNATKLEYDYAATKAEITLGKILNWLKTFNVYWDIYEINGRPYLRIEHKLFYLNGGAYTKQPKTDIDLRLIHDTWGDKVYSYETNNWKYEDVNNVATKIYYKWMDEVSLPFEGDVMQAVDNPYGEEHQETRTAEAFTSDIDYIFANNNAISKDGFVVVQGYKADGERAYSIHFYETEINGRSYNLQNGLLSVAYMQRYYMPYDMPSKQMQITGGDIVDVQSTKQLRQNEVKFALPQGVDIGVYSPIITEVGTGTIGRMEQDLDSEIYNVTLKYDNEL